MTVDSRMRLRLKNGIAAFGQVIHEFNDKRAVL
jgi:hypothetical protein